VDIKHISRLFKKQDNPDIYQYEKIEKSDLIKTSEPSPVSERNNHQSLD
jgi:hypothetical protein